MSSPPLRKLRQEDPNFKASLGDFVCNPNRVRDVGLWGNCLETTFEGLSV